MVRELDQLEDVERRITAVLSTMRDWSNKSSVRLIRSEVLPLVNELDRARANLRLVRQGEPVREYISHALRKATYQRDKGICQRCRAAVPFHDAEIDHLIPVSRGGPSEPDNLRILCRTCNREKASAMPYGGLGAQQGLAL